MTIERVSGFVMTQDSVHGVPTWKVRIKQVGHELDGKKCRVMSLHGEYEPRQSDTVSFVVGSKVEGGNTIYLAYDVVPVVDTLQKETARVEEEGPSTMNWFIVDVDGELHANCLGFRSLQEAQADLHDNGAEDEKVVAFIPFDIREHVDKWDDPGVEEAFALVEALQRTTPTLVALEKLVTALVREAVKVKA